MKFDAIIGDSRAVWQTQTAIADAKLRHLLLRSGINAFAALICAFGLLMAELAVYFSLIQLWSAIVAAVVLSVLNFVIAAMLVFIGMRTPHARELALLDELHCSAVERLKGSVRDLRGDVTGPHALETLLPVLILPLVSALTRMLRRKRAQDEKVVG
jgi:hypothetical protein